MGIQLLTNTTWIDSAQNVSASEWRHMDVLASEITDNPTDFFRQRVQPDLQQRKHQGSGLLAFCAKNLRWKVNSSQTIIDRPDSKVHGANMGPTWVLSAPGGPHEPRYQGGEFPVPGKRRAFRCHDVFISSLPTHTAHPMNTQTGCGALGLYRFSAPVVYIPRLEEW